MNIDLRWTISHNAEIVLGEHWKQFDYSTDIRKAWVTSFDGRFGETKEYRYKVSAVLHICVTQRHEVFHAVTSSNMLPKPELWIFDSAHDSCWREMPFIHQFYMEMCKKAEPSMRPIDVEYSVTQWTSKIINVRIAKDKDENGIDHHYNRHIVEYVVGKTIDFKDVKCGKPFYIAGKSFQKLYEPTENYNAISFSDGRLINLLDTEKVEAINE